ncbi:MAG: hypothetical protein GC178_14025 [Flavobacteriales bacterium]|nr:hypothetical protein [Flavobacteriales bacterium]
MKIKSLSLVNLPLVGFLILTLSIAGCNKDDKDDKDDPTTGQPLITAIILSGGNPIDISTYTVSVVDPSRSGQGILDAVVTVNAIVLSGNGSGGYSYVDHDTPIQEGGTVALSVSVNGTAYTATGTMPANGQSSDLAIDGAYTGSTLHIENNP